MCRRAAFTVALLLVAAQALAAADKTKNILAIYWYGPDSVSNRSLDRGLQRVLADASPTTPVEYFNEYLEADRFQGRSLESTMRQYLARKYADRTIDAIVVDAEPVLEFLLQSRATLFAGVPIVYHSFTPAGTGVKATARNITGVVASRQYAETLELARRLQPDLTDATVIVSSPNGRGTALQQAIRRELDTVSGATRVHFLTDQTTERILTAVGAAPLTSAVIYVGHSEQGPQRSLRPAEALALIAEASPVPVYGVVSSAVGQGAVGGVVVDFEDLGEQLGSMAMRIARGDKADDIPVARSTLNTMVDARELERWRMDETRLPVGAVVQFRTPNRWNRYGSYVAIVAAFFLASTVLLAGLLWESGRRRQAEAAIRVSEAERDAVDARNRELAGRLITAQEAERVRIARDLHDEVSQDLAGVAVAMSRLRSQMGEVDEAEAQRQLFQVQQRVATLAESVRLLSHDLHPTVLAHVGLVAALEAHAAEAERHYDIQVGVEVGPGVDGLDEQTSLCLFRIAQESVRNAARHGQARRVQVSLSRREGAILRIVDDGQGFDVRAVRRASPGLGLTSMEERARMLGGRVSVRSRPGEGTTVETVLPA